VIELVEKGLHYIAARHEFEVTALVGLASAGGGASVPLPREVVFLISAPVDDVNPPQVTITHVNPPYVPVVLRVANPTDNMTLELTALGQRAPPVSLAVRRPKLIISAAPSRILGWGLESASINVQVEETGDGKLPPIILSNDRGRLEISTLVLGGGNVATTRLFSTGLKGAKITSSSFPVAIVTAANVEFAFPFAFTISLVIGGLVGAWISQRSFTGSLVAGVGVGLIVGVLYVFGVNLLKLQIDAPHASDAVGFVLSALGGFFGPKLLELLKPTPAQPIGDTAS
jgi:hypothetical protein